MTLPLYRVLGQPGLNLQEFGNMDYARLIYRTQEAYARQIFNGGEGAIFNGNAGARIGSSVDTRATQRTNTNPSRFPAHPGIGRVNVTFNYGRNVPTVAAPVITEEGGNEGWLCYTGPREVNVAGDRTFETSTDTQLVMDNIVTPALNNLRGGGVGSVMVSTRTPGPGWENAGRWFLDTRFTGNIDYRLWVRTSDGLPAVNRRPLQTGFVEMDTGSNGNFVQNICLPLLTRIAPSYRVRNDRAGTRGLWTDTRLTGTANTTRQRNIDAYDSISTPSGAAVTINTYTLEMI